MYIRAEGRLWEVMLDDDGTLDTLVTVQPVRGRFDKDGNILLHAWTVRFSMELAAQYRRKDGSMTLTGLRELGKEAVLDYPEEF